MNENDDGVRACVLMGSRSVMSAVLAAFAWCWGAIAAESNSAPVPIGVELGGKVLRLACCESGGVRDVPVPQADAIAVAERFARTSLLTADDVRVMKSAMVSIFPSNRIKDVVLALPRGLPWDSRRSIFAAFSKNGIAVVRCVDRTTACAFSFQNRNPSFDGRLIVEDRGEEEREVTCVSIGDGVCEVEDVFSTKNVGNDSNVRRLKITDDGLDVVHGAARQAGVLRGLVRGQLLLDVVGYDVGILDCNGEFQMLIEKHKTIPAIQSSRIAFKDVGDVYVCIRDGRGGFQKLGGPFTCARSESAQFQMMKIDVDQNRNMTIHGLLDKDSGTPGNVEVMYREGVSKFSLSDKPLMAKDVVVHTALTDVTVPAPEGFWTLDDGNPLASILKVQAEADKSNKTLGQWVMTESGNWDDMRHAFVKVPIILGGKAISLSDFEQSRASMRKGITDAAKKIASKAENVAKAVSRELTGLVETNVTVAIGDVRILEPHLDRRDCLGFTIIRKEINDVGGERSVSCSVASCAMIWIHGAVVSLNLGYSVPESEDAVNAAVIATREKLNQWLERVGNVNKRSSLDAENEIVQNAPNLMKFDTKREGTLSSILGRAVMWAIIGGVVGLISSLFKKNRNKKDGRMESDKDE